LNSLRTKRGLPENGIIFFKDRKADCIKVLAEEVRKAIDMQRVCDIIGTEKLTY